MKSYKVVIPEEEFICVEFIQDDKKGFATVNVALDGFEPKVVFSWHCSVLIDYKLNSDETSLTDDEQDMLENIKETFDTKIKAKGNAMFLAQVKHDGRMELVWRIYNPEVTNDFLTNLIQTKEYLRPFDFRIEQDNDWDKANWFLDNARL